MASGDLIVFNKAMLAFFDGTHDLDTDTFKFAVCDNTVNPSVTMLTPNLSDFTEVGVLGTYVAGGELCAGLSLSESSGIITFDMNNITGWLADVLNDNDAYWGILYNTTAGDAIGFVDLVGPFNMQTTALDIVWNALGLFTVGKNT